MEPTTSFDLFPYTRLGKRASFVLAIAIVTLCGQICLGKTPLREAPSEELLLWVDQQFDQIYSSNQRPTEEALERLARRLALLNPEMADIFSADLQDHMSEYAGSGDNRQTLDRLLKRLGENVSKQHEQMSTERLDASTDRIATKWAILIIAIAVVVMTGVHCVLLHEFKLIRASLRDIKDHLSSIDGRINTLSEAIPKVSTSVKRSDSSTESESK